MGPKVCSLLTEPCHAGQAAQFGLEVVSTVICLLTPCDSLYMSRRTKQISFNNFFLHEHNQFQQPSPHEPPYHSKAECAREGGKKASVRTQISV